MDGITVVATLKAKAGKEAELKKELLALIVPTRKEAGCIRYDLHQEIQNPGLFVFYEQWKSQKDLENHLGSPHLTALQAKLGGLLSEVLDVKVMEMIG